MQKEIRKVKVTKGRTLEVELVEHMPDQSDRDISMKCDQLVHDDMMKAFDRLKIHLVIICDLYEGRDIEPESFDPENELKKFKVTSFSVGGSDDNEGVTITGQKELSGGKILNLNTPFTKYYDEADPYLYSSEMAESIHRCIYEAEQYLYEGKYAVKQLELPFDEVSDEPNALVDAINKPKKGGRKKEYTVDAIPSEY